jgi:hypothetical protein
MQVLHRTPPEAPALRNSLSSGWVLAVLVAYVVLTGDLPKAIQAVLFGVERGNELQFAVAFVSSVALDVVRLSPLFFLGRGRDGILHPLTVTVLLWPILLQAPYFIETMGANMAGLTGQAVRASTYGGLPGWSSAEVWLAEAKYNGIEIVSIFALFVGYYLADTKAAAGPEAASAWDTAGLRRLLLGICFAVLVGAFAFLAFRGGLSAHLQDLSRGRARSLEGLGPIVALFDFGTLSLMIWMAARPGDAKSPIFIALLFAMIAVQFISDGSRSSAFLVVAKVALVWALRSRRLPWRTAAVATPLALMLFGTFAIIRSSGLYGDTAFEALRQTEISQVMTTMQDELQGRLYISGSVPVIADGQKVMGGPMLGRTYLGAVFAWIPRPLWENKPRGAGSIFAQNFLGADREGFAVPIGSIAEAYWNFDLPGVVVLFLLHGLILRKIYEWYRGRSTDPFVLVLFSMFLTDFRMGTDNLVPFMQQVAELTLVFVLALALGLRRGSAPARRAHPPASTIHVATKADWRAG